MKFKGWLKKQMKRNDPVGDYARDWVMEEAVPHPGKGQVTKMSYDDERVKSAFYESLREYSSELLGLIFETAQKAGHEPMKHLGNDLMDEIKQRLLEKGIEIGDVR
jgi:hypothetical protein